MGRRKGSAADKGPERKPGQRTHLLVKTVLFTGGGRHYPACNAPPESLGPDGFSAVASDITCPDCKVIESHTKGGAQEPVVEYLTGTSNDFDPEEPVVERKPRRAPRIGLPVTHIQTSQEPVKQKGVVVRTRIWSACGLDTEKDVTPRGTLFYDIPEGERATCPACVAWLEESKRTPEGEGTPTKSVQTDAMSITGSLSSNESTLSISGVSAIKGMPPPPVKRGPRRPKDSRLCSGCGAPLYAKNDDTVACRACDRKPTRKETRAFADLMDRVRGNSTAQSSAPVIIAKTAPPLIEAPKKRPPKRGEVNLEDLQPTVFPAPPPKKRGRPKQVDLAGKPLKMAKVESVMRTSMVLKADQYGLRIGEETWAKLKEETDAAERAAKARRIVTRTMKPLDPDAQADVLAGAVEQDHQRLTRTLLHGG